MHGCHLQLGPNDADKSGYWQDSGCNKWLCSTL